MNKKDLGIDPANRQHNKLLTVIENRFLGILWTDHVGAENKISANELAVKFDCAMEGFEPEREVSILVLMEVVLKFGIMPETMFYKKFQSLF